MLLFYICWSVEYYSPDIEQTILELPEGLLARYLRLTDLMLEFGANLGMPHTRFIQNGLCELRVKSKEGIARVFSARRSGKELSCCLVSSRSRCQLRQAAMISDAIKRANLRMSTSMAGQSPLSKAFSHADTRCKISQHKRTNTETRQDTSIT